MAEAHESVVGIGEEKDEFAGLAMDGTAFDAATMISAAVMDRMANTPMSHPKHQPSNLSHSITHRPHLMLCHASFSRHLFVFR